MSWDLYELMQSLSTSQRDLEAHFKADIEAKLGHSVEILKNDPDLVRALLSDTDVEKRECAVNFLGKFDQALPDYKQIFERLAVDDPAPSVRSMAITWLGELGTYRHRAEIVRFLHTILTNRIEEDRVRRAAYSAMELIDLATNPPRTVDGILQGLEDLFEQFQNGPSSVEEVIDPCVISRLMGLDED